MEFVNQMHPLQSIQSCPISASGHLSLRRMRSAFTLIELLAVIIVMSLLIAATAPMVFSSLAASRLTSTGESLLADLSFAQQTSISLGQTTEVRFYKFKPENGFDDASSWGGYQVFRVFDQPTQNPKNPTGPLVSELPLTEPRRFREGVLAASAQSPLLTTGALATESGSVQYFPVAGANYTSFRFTSDGSTNITLPLNGSYITLAAFSSGEESATLPANIYTIQINPSTGNLRSYRPSL